MADTPTYQIAFQFQFKQDVQKEIIQVVIADQNSFVISSSCAAQLGPFDGTQTPPLSNMSVSSNTLFLNVASGIINQGVEVIVWVTAIDGSLKINLMADGSVAAYYAELDGQGATGQLKPGLNTIQLGSGG